jgi:hypothetical protein
VGEPAASGPSMQEKPRSAIRQQAGAITSQPRAFVCVSHLLFSSARRHIQTKNTPPQERGCDQMWVRERNSGPSGWQTGARASRPLRMRARCPRSHRRTSPTFNHTQERRAPIAGRADFFCVPWNPQRRRICAITNTSR